MPSKALSVVKITDAHLNDLYTNEGLTELSGYDEEELDELGWINIVDPQAQSLFEEIVSSAEKMPYVLECLDANIMCRDGSTRTLAWEVVSLSPDRFPLMLITAKESAQKRLPGSGFVRTRRVSPVPPGLWEEIFDSLPDCVTIHDSNFRIIAANQAVRERLGLSLSEIVGRKCHEVFHGTAHPTEHCVLLQVMSGPPGMRARRETYERQFKCICQAEAVAFDNSKSGMRGILHTLRTSDILASGPGAISRRELDRLSRLASAIAHDYNNLLSGIVGYTGMLQMLGDLPEKAVRYVGELQKAASRLNEMTQRLLLFGRRRKLNPQPVDVVRLVRDALGSAELVPEERPVHYEPPDEPMPAMVEPLQIQVVLSNLVRNALEATETSGGHVVVRTSRRSLAGPCPTFFNTAPAGEYVCLEISDTGPGIEPDRLAHVFEPYGDPENRALGRGLGLAIVYRIVQNHDGFIEADSEIGVGTRITILLPAAPEAGQRPTQQ